MRMRPGFAPAPMSKRPSSLMRSLTSRKSNSWLDSSMVPLSTATLPLIPRRRIWISPRPMRADRLGPIQGSRHLGVDARAAGHVRDRVGHQRL